MLNIKYLALQTERDIAVMDLQVTGFEKTYKSNHKVSNTNFLLGGQPNPLYPTLLSDIIPKHPRCHAVGRKEVVARASELSIDGNGTAVALVDLVAQTK